MCWTVVLIYGHTLGNSWVYFNFQINLAYVPLHFGLIEKNFYIFCKVCVPFLPLKSFYLLLLFLSDAKSQPCLWCQGVRADRPFCQERDLGACFRWGKRGSADGKKKFRGARGGRAGIHTTELRGKWRDQDNFPVEGERTSFPGFGNIIQHAWVTLSIPQKLYCCTHFGWGALEGAGAAVTCCFCPCLRLQQQQILLIEARIIGFPKARTHTHCQQLCISSEAVQKSTACSHVALELIVTARDKEILSVTRLSAGFPRKTPPKLGTDLISCNLPKRF